MSDNNIKDTELSNEVAKKIHITSKLPLFVGVVVLIVGLISGSLFDKFWTTMSLSLSLIITSICLEGFAEIIQLLQEIKDK